MAWIESHQELANHPKTKRFRRALGGISTPQAIGHLHLLWWWALDYAQDGNLTGFDADEIADACEWEGDPEQLAHALEVSGFLDAEDNQLHDWDEYGGKYLKRRDQARERQQRHRKPETRESQSSNALHDDSHALVTRDTRVSHTATGQEKTREDKTGEERTETGVPPASVRLIVPEVSEAERTFAEFWALYPKGRGSKKLSLDEWKKLKPPERHAAISALPAFVACHDWQKEGGRFVRHAERWLKARGWEDDVPAAPPRKPNFHDAGVALEQFKEQRNGHVQAGAAEVRGTRKPFGPWGYLDDDSPALLDQVEGSRSGRRDAQHGADGGDVGPRTQGPIEARYRVGS